MSSPRETPIPTAATTTLRTDTLADSVLILLALSAVQRVVGFCRAVFFCRWLDADQLGQWDMAFSFLLVAAPLSVLSLSGSFRRYVEYYRQRFQLRTLLRRTAIFYAVCGTISATVIWLGRDGFSQLAFGSASHGRLVALMAVSLLAVLAYHFFIDLLTSLRNVRLLCTLQFLQSLIFAVVGVVLLLVWQRTATSVVAAYAVACAVVSAVAVGWLVRSWSALPQQGPPTSHGQLWAKLLPFAAWIWLASLTGNLFEVADRYMIVHFSSFPPEEALALVGQYHSSRVVPLLLVSVAVMLGAVITPHLSDDWEAGRRGRVSARLNLYLKLTGFGLSAAAVAVMFAAPVLFDLAFQGKFTGGLAVLPWTLTYCIWFGFTTVAINYLWCAEKAGLASLALLAGLVANVILNLMLLPRLGLLGAVLATCAANLVALLLIAAFNHRLGFRMNRGTWVVIALPPLVCLGPWVALVVLVALAVDTVCHDRLLSREEKRQITEGWLEYRERFRVLRLASRSAG